MAAAPEADDSADAVIKDSNGNVLADGDAVVLIKDLKVKGSSTTLKMGTKVKSIRLVGGDHEVDCKMDGPPENGIIDNAGNSSDALHRLFC